MALTDQQIQDIADKVIAALQQLAPSEPSGWVIVSSMAPVAALLAAGLVTYIGYRNLKHQQRALKVSVRSDARNLNQKRTADATNLEQKRLADARSEWWRRTQWALEATASDAEDDVMYDYGTKMLGVLARSDLAGPEEKAMLDAVWQGSATEMLGDEIDDLVEEAREEQDETQRLTNSLDQQLRSYLLLLDDPTNSGDNGTNEEEPHDD